MMNRDDASKSSDMSDILSVVRSLTTKSAIISYLVGRYVDMSSVRLQSTFCLHPEVEGSMKGIM